MVDSAAAHASRDRPSRQARPVRAARKGPRWARGAPCTARRDWTAQSGAGRVARRGVAEVQEHRRSAAGASEEAELLARLRAGDERAFESLVESYHGTMIAVARTYVKTRDVAEEVVQEAWIGVLGGLDRFEGRASLKTWIMRILVNTAMARGGREARSVPFSSLAPAGEEPPAVEPERFRQPGKAFAGH